jgi:hypothetical protein
VQGLRSDETVKGEGRKAEEASSRTSHAGLFLILILASWLPRPATLRPYGILILSSPTKW